MRKKIVSLNLFGMGAGMIWSTVATSNLSAALAYSLIFGNAVMFLYVLRKSAKIKRC